jgi:hypothetical protein
MKPFLSTTYLILLLAVICSCKSKNNFIATEAATVNNKYTLVTSYQKPGKNKPNTITTLFSDTTVLFEKEDSAAYLKAAIQFRQYMADWNITKKTGAKQPVSFKLLNEKAEDIAGNLSAAQSKKADSSVKTYIQQKINTRYSISDNVQSLDNITKEKSVNDTSDIKKADKARQHQLYTRGGKYTYSPI